MKTKPSSPDHQDKPIASENQAVDPQLLSTLAEELGTEENVEKLAKKLSKEWSKGSKKKQASGLPFSDFLDKLKKAKNQ